MSVYTKSIEFDTFDTAHDFRSHALSLWSLHSSGHQQKGCKIRNKLLLTDVVDSPKFQLPGQSFCQ